MAMLCLVAVVAGNFIRAIHTLAIHGFFLWSEAANLDSQCVCHGESEDVAFDIETATKVIKNRDLTKTTECGDFVLWQINPDMWYVELTLGASKVQPVAMGGLCGGTHPGLVRMLPNGLLDPCAVLFRLLLVFSIIS
ncbi:hypothetical protein HanXRQr2_Chr01g0039551 [Helianthus annuus]|uniref:Uncharacterized protein n=1 Tax=Helianthus annuus TaxID=4232 RepID=A0A9K3P4I0_HELAN|nr:hypothetical protein HanXRQr2_Chr01g0039551 [Helianthus annuus]